MKTILTCVILMCTSIMYAQPIDSIAEKTKTEISDIVTTVDTSSNFKMIYNDFKSGIEAAAFALKVGTEHVYIVFVKQQIVKSITGLILLLIPILIFIFTIREVIKFIKNRVVKEDSAGAFILSLGYFLLILIWVVFGLSDLNLIVTGFVNPEYGVIKEILNTVSPESLKNCTSCQQ